MVKSTTDANYKHGREQKHSPRDAHLLGNLEPGLFETEDRAAIERRCYLKHGVVIVETATDVSHRHPFLYDCYSSDHILTAQNLCGNEVAYLAEEREEKMVYPRFSF